MVKRKGLKPRTAASLKRYNLTVEEWQKIRDQQGGRCAICGKGGLTKHLSVDHDHTLEKAGIMVVRGLLCVRCNRALGAWEWDDGVLKRAADYIERIRLTRDRLLGYVVPMTDNTSKPSVQQKEVS